MCVLSEPPHQRYSPCIPAVRVVESERQINIHSIFLHTLPPSKPMEKSPPPCSNNPCSRTHCFISTMLFNINIIQQTLYLLFSSHLTHLTIFLLSSYFLSSIIINSDDAAIYKSAHFLQDLYLGEIRTECYQGWSYRDRGVSSAPWIPWVSSPLQSDVAWIYRTAARRPSSWFISTSHYSYSLRQNHLCIQSHLLEVMFNRSQGCM